MAKILIVDDEHLTIEMLSTFLQIIGHQTVAALSGRQTWERLSHESPDLILLDIMLPDDNGLEICRKLRAQEATRLLPIIMISAYSPALTKEATAAGATGYLSKPIKLDVLKAAIARSGVR
jgi:CheY-like chemotaxis protein